MFHSDVGSTNNKTQGRVFDQLIPKKAARGLKKNSAVCLCFVVFFLSSCSKIPVKNLNSLVAAAV